MTIVFEVVGGIGKNIIATAIVKLLRKKYPNAYLIVVASVPEIFDNNPNINAVFPPNQRYIVNDFINKDTLILLHDPYCDSDFITKKQSVYKSWSNLYDLDYNQEQPELFITEDEINNYTKLFDTSKPILVIHPYGGPIIPEETTPKFTFDKGYNWVRDIPLIVCNTIIEKYKNDYNIYQIKHPTQKRVLEGVKIADNPIREIMVLLKLSSKRILIDSFPQHMAAALNLKSTVCWVGTSVENFGYDLHNNILPNPYTLIPQFTTYGGFNYSEPINYMPYKNTLDIFNINKILK